MKCFEELYHQFMNEKNSLKEVQERVLQKILSQQSDTVFGKKHSFNTMDLTGFRKLPLIRYEDIEEDVKRIMSTGISRYNKNIKVLEPTSGSTGACKYIPFTALLQEEFSAAIHPWLYSLYTENNLEGLHSYWSISPKIDQDHPPSIVRIGFQNDYEYLDADVSNLVEFYNPVPSKLQQKNFMRRTLQYLLNDKKLGLISIWNPMFLVELCNQNISEIIEEMKTIKDKPLDVSTQSINQERVKELNNLWLNSHENFFEKAWPHLNIISCWTHGMAQHFIPEVISKFPQARIESKGLMATEAFVSIPIDEKDPVLAYQSHFFEFINSQGKIMMAHELEEGEQYEVVVTTGGGLYRYRLFDLVTITGFWHSIPRLRFDGKANVVSDLVGEKLHEQFVRSTIEEHLPAQTLFYILAPVLVPKPHYELIIEASDVPNILSGLIEEGLQKNMYYKQARSIGQLSRLEVREVDNAASLYMDYLAQRMKIGDMKSFALTKETGFVEFIEKTKQE